MFIIAGCVFVTGAIGLEMIGGNYVALHGEPGKTHLAYALIATVEELLEMMGIIIFIYALMQFYLADLPSPISVNILVAGKETATPGVVRPQAPELPLVDESLH